MPATNLAQLLNFEGNFETAAYSLLVSEGVVAAITEGQTNLPLVVTGIGVDVAPAIDELQILTKPNNWPGGTPPPQEYFRYPASIEFRIEIPRDKNGTSYAGALNLMGEVRGKIRSFMLRCVAPFNANNLPFYEIGDIKPAGASFGWDSTRNVDFSWLRYQMTFAIRPTAWPTWIES